jgi:hypothetical protein
MEEMSIKPKVIRAGNANMFLSKLFRQTLADLTQTPVELYNTDGAKGAALASGIGIGYYKSAKEALEKREEEKNPGKEIEGKKQISFADTDACIMGKKGNFDYQYNGQISVDADNQIIYDGSTASAPVLTDIYRVKSVTLPNGKRVKVGSPVLYYKADVSSRLFYNSNNTTGDITDTQAENSIFNSIDNEDLIALGTVKDQSVRHYFDPGVTHSDGRKGRKVFL